MFLGKNFFLGIGIGIGLSGDAVDSRRLLGDGGAVRTVDATRVMTLKAGGVRT